MFTAYSAVAPEAFQPGFVRTQIAMGRYTFLLKLQNYNGTPNDREVIVSFFVSSGVEGVQTSDGGDLPPPTFDGGDVWTVDPLSLLSGVSANGRDCLVDATPCAPKYSDGQAYVVDGLLVAHIDAPLRIGLTMGTFHMDVKGGVMVARLTRSGASFSLAGDYGGRLQIGDLLRGLAFFRAPVGPGFLCPGVPLFDNLKGKLCEHLDLRGQQAEDGRELPCDALSTSLSFDAYPAQLGHVWQPQPEVHPCTNVPDAAAYRCP